MRNSEFLTTEEKDKIKNIKKAINYRVEKYCKGKLTSYELDRICCFIDIGRQYKVIAVSNKKSIEDLVNCGYSVSRNSHTGEDVITRYRVYPILGRVSLGYKRGLDLLKPTKVLSDRCVLCVQECKTGYDGEKFVRESRLTLYIYIQECGTDENR